MQYEIKRISQVKSNLNFLHWSLMKKHPFDRYRRLKTIYLRASANRWRFVQQALRTAGGNGGHFAARDAQVIENC
jgi:hypothetical protein